MQALWILGRRLDHVDRLRSSRSLQLNQAVSFKHSQVGLNNLPPDVLQIETMSACEFRGHQISSSRSSRNSGGTPPRPQPYLSSLSSRRIDGRMNRWV